jgi:hypothetical protein
MQQHRNIEVGGALRDKGLTLNSATGAQKIRGRPV